MAASLLPRSADGTVVAPRLGHAAATGCSSSRMDAGGTSACSGCKVQLGAGGQRGAGRLNWRTPWLLLAVPEAGRSTPAVNLPRTAGSAACRSLAPGSRSVSSGVRSSARGPPPACACCCRRRARQRARMSPSSGLAPGRSAIALPAGAAGGLPSAPCAGSAAALLCPSGAACGPGAALCGGCMRSDRKRLYLSAKLLPCSPACGTCGCACRCRRARHSARMSPEEAGAAKTPSAQLTLRLAGAACSAAPAKAVLPAGAGRPPAAGLAAAAPWLQGATCGMGVYRPLAGAAASAAPSWLTALAGGPVALSGGPCPLVCSRSCGAAARSAGCNSRATRRAAGVSPPLL